VPDEGHRVIQVCINLDQVFPIKYLLNAYFFIPLRRGVGIVA
jgi:hypothetical protein